MKPEGHLTDFAQVVDAPTKGRIENYLRRVKEGTKAEVAIVVIRRLDDEPIADVANQLYRQWGIGSKETNEGVLFLIALDDRKTRLEVGYGLEAIIPDGFAGGILRQIRPAMREKNYGEAISEVARILGSRIAEAKGVTIPDSLTRRRRVEPDSLPWPVIIFLILAVLFLFGGGGGRRGGFGFPFPIFLPGGFGRGSGGGGFGGYDSGGGSGGFGGFGGGDSGGGGASGDW